MPQPSLAASQELASEPYNLAVDHLPRRSYLSDLSGHEQPVSIKKPPQMAMRLMWKDIESAPDVKI